MAAEEGSRTKARLVSHKTKRGGMDRGRAVLTHGQAPWKCPLLHLNIFSVCVCVSIYILCVCVYILYIAMAQSAKCL